MWNNEIRQNIIKELNEQFNAISPVIPAENHSYIDSIFSTDVHNMYKPIDIASYETPNYYERTINSMKTIKEVPVHTLAFSDSFEDKKSSSIGYTYGFGMNSYNQYGTTQNISSYTYDNVIQKSDSTEVEFDMDSIINNPNAITFSLTPEQRNVAIAKRVTWRDIMFNDVSLIGNTEFGRAIKEFCSIQIKI